MGHAVCVIDNLIFDSTQKHPLRLCQESLDWICGEDGCADIYFAVRFHENYKTKRKLKRQMILHT